MYGSVDAYGYGCMEVSMHRFMRVGTQRTWTLSTYVHGAQVYARVRVRLQITVHTHA